MCCLVQNILDTWYTFCSGSQINDSLFPNSHILFPCNYMYHTGELQCITYTLNWECDGDSCQKLVRCIESVLYTSCHYTTSLLNFSSCSASQRGKQQSYLSFSCSTTHTHTLHTAVFLKGATLLCNTYWYDRFYCTHYPY